jgi:hypothetical protein
MGLISANEMMRPDTKKAPCSKQGAFQNLPSNAWTYDADVI